jgi:nucleoid-associated protein YgaU
VGLTQVAPAPSKRIPPVVAAPQTWTVRPGDSLWSIAASTLSEQVGRSVSDTEIGHYWVRLVDLNRHVLPVPSDPDLIFSGNSIALPPVDAADLGRGGS